MNLQDVYMIARSMSYIEFKAYVSKKIDNIPSTVENNNEYVVVNAKDINQH